LEREADQARMKLAFPRDVTQYIISGTDSFRTGSRKLLSNKNKNLKNANFGGNRQNLEKSMRQIWKSDPGYSLVQCDQAGAEALIVAYLCRPGKYRQLFQFGIKPHTYIAMKLAPHVWMKHFDEAKIKQALASDIPTLKALPFWKDLDKLIKSSDNWPAQERYYHFGKKTAHCVDRDTEVLTPNGWIKCSDYVDQEIMVWSENKCFFERPNHWNIFSYNGYLINFSGANYNQLVTPNHRMPFYSPGIRNKLTLRVREAGDIIDYKGGRLPTAGVYIGGQSNLSADEARLIAAIQADGSFSHNRVRFHFRKDRKVDRMFHLLTRMGIKFERNVAITAINTVDVYYTFDRPKFIDGYLDDNKCFTYKLTSLSRDAMDAFLGELKYWDGSIHYTETNGRQQQRYSSNHRINLEVIKTLLHLSNCRGSISPKPERNNYRMSVGAKRNMARLNNDGPAKPEHYEGSVYCPTTTTGFFFIRRNGEISVTGNSGSYGMRERTFQMSMLKESGGLINLSFEQAAKFLLTFHSEFPEIQEWHVRVYQQAKRFGLLRNLLGYPFQVTDYVREDDFKDLIAWCPQSTVASITRQAVVRWSEYVEENNLPWYFLHETHDSFLTQCPHDDVVANAKLMRSFIEIEMISPFDNTKFRMKSEAQHGLNWSPQKEGTNPDGLREVVFP
jgi:hypothetical protein